jgi:hypothetical protein
MTISILILAVIALLLISPFVLRFRKDKKRTDGMRLAAEALGLTFAPKGVKADFNDLASFQLFTQSRAAKFVNVMRGVTDDLKIAVFDYSYSVGSEESLEDTWQTVVSFRSTELDVPAFCLRPKNLLHKLASLFGYQVINFDTHPRFSDLYLLRGRDENAVRKLFGDDALSYLERGTSYMIEGSGTQLLFYRATSKVEPEQVRFFVQEVFEIAGLLWPNSSRRSQELTHDLRQRFGVRVAGNVAAPPERHSSGIRQPPE